MRVQREALLKSLEMLSPGLATRETIAQSSCLVFSGERVMTFNEEILASVASPLPELNGAVKAKPLLDLLAKLQDDADIDITQKETELSVKGKGRRSGIRMEAEVLLPVEVVEIPKEWRKLPEEFSEAIAVAYPCAGSDQSKFVFTCVHISPEYVESCDRFQIARFPLATGVEKDILVRADSIKKICGCGMIEVCETESWIHFRNAEGLVLSFRRFLDEYGDLGKFLQPDGTERVTLPGALEEVVSRAEIFTAENAIGNFLTVDLTKEYLQVSGEGASGWYQERKQVVYEGEPIRFQIPPRLLVAIAKRSQECRVGAGRLFVDTGKFQFCTCTVNPSIAEKKEEK